MTSGLASTLKHIGLKPKPNITIKIHDAPRDAFSPLVYTSRDQIKGEVAVTAQSALNFEDIYITFEGSTRTWVEKIATASATQGRTEGFQNFLRLMEPFDPDYFPEPRVLEANKTYTFPFTFVVPERLLPQSCTHPGEEHFDRDQHLALPPSLGDPLPAGSGRSMIDDMTPEMACVAYSIKCRITSGKGTSGKHTVLVESTKKLRVLPTVDEAPPLDARGGLHDDYRLRKEKSIRKGIFRQKLGRLVVESVQPSSFRLPGVRSDDGCSVTTMATLNLRFDPLDESAQPPRLNNITSKLKVATFYATQPVREIPIKSGEFHYSNFRGLYVDTVPLSQRCLANTSWQKQGRELSPPARRDSTWTTAATKTPAPSEAFNAKYPFYTAHVVVPLSLPKGNKVFLPTFHSCLVSRIYALDLYLSVHTPNANVSDPTVHLKLPVQVSVQGEPHPTVSLTPQEVNAIASQEVDALFSPRNVAPPTPELTERSSSIIGSPQSSPRIGRSNRNSTSDDASPFSSPRMGFDHRDPIAEEGDEWKAPPNATQAGNFGLGLSSSPTTINTAAANDVPPSPGPGYTHRPSFSQDTRPTTTTTPQAYYVRMAGAQQRFQSLSFENEEQALGPPPGYNRIPSRTRETPRQRQGSGQGQGQGQVASSGSSERRSSG